VVDGYNISKESLDADSCEVLDTTSEESLNSGLEDATETSITESSLDTDEEMENTTFVEGTEIAQEEADKTENQYDIILQVNPEKISQIKSQIIDGQKCIIIPINEDEQTTINGLYDLI